MKGTYFLNMGNYRSLTAFNSSTIRLTIDNISSIPVNFLRLAFEDSTIAHAQQTLAEGNLSVYDTYETEHDLINRPVFSWTSDESRPIAPNQNLTLTLSCFGKVGWFVIVFPILRGLTSKLVRTGRYIFHTPTLPIRPRLPRFSTFVKCLIL